MIRKGNKHNVWGNGNTIAHYCTTLFLSFPYSFVIPGSRDVGNYGYKNRHQFNAILR